MGSDCARISPKVTNQNRNVKQQSTNKESCVSQQPLHLEIYIENVRVTNITKIVSSITFEVEKYWKMVFSQNEISVHDKIIKWGNKHKGSFIIDSKFLQKNKMKVTIFGHKNKIIEEMSFQLYQLCMGTYHHDHLLRELKSRLAFDIKILQKQSVKICVSNLNLNFMSLRQSQQVDYNYSLTLVVKFKLSQSGSQEKTYNSERITKLNQENSFTIQILSNSLEECMIKLSIWKIRLKITDKYTDIYIPYRKVISQPSIILTSKDKELQIRNLSLQENLIVEGKLLGKAKFMINVQNSKLQVEQMQCLISSENGIGTISPQHITMDEKGISMPELFQKLKQFQTIQNSYNKKDVKNIKRILKEINQLIKPMMKINYSSDEQFYDLFILLVEILTKASKMMKSGQDIINQNLWKVINTIIHRPQLSIRYFNIITSPQRKQQAASRYYCFICLSLEKIILSTTIGVTYLQLQCMQQFISYMYFRFRWLQNVVLKAFTKTTDPSISHDKLVEIGACLSSKSPSKSVVYDWETSVFKFCSKNVEFKKAFSRLVDLNFEISDWSKILFNRSDEELFYGLLIKIWNQAQLSLSYQGKIRWEYFPCYGQLLGTFLGQMMNNKIIDYTDNFKKCSLKLIMNQRLLNTFMMLLFPKTCLFETYCVMKCLDLVESYFEILAASKKKLPNDFNFNYFYAGLKSIFQYNHSHLLVKALTLIYTHYDIFSKECKSTINSYMLGKGFYRLFLHWCSFVRKLFYFLIHFKILLTSPLNPQNSNFEQKESNLHLQTKQKFNILLKQLQEGQKQHKKQVNKKVNQPIYYLYLREKLINKKKQRKQVIQLNKVYKFSQFKREMSLKENEYDHLFQKHRKWSMSDEEKVEQIPLELRTYLQVSLQQFHQLSNHENSNQQVNKISKIFAQEGRTIDA